jgi:tape measure domain-containing protein
MGNVLEFYLKMKDMMSSGLAKVAKAGKDAFGQIQSAVNKTIANTSTLASSNNKLSNSYSELQRRLDSVKQKMQEATDPKRIDTYRRAMVNLNRELQGHAANDNSGKGSMMGGMLRRFAPAAIAAGALAFGGSAAKASMDFGATEKSYQVLAGNKQGGKLVNNLNQLQQDTILGPEVFKSGQTLLGFGVAAKNVLPDIQMLGDVAMGNKDKFQSLTLAFSQTQAAGKLMGQDLLQYINAGFNPLQEISIMTGKSMGVLKDEMEKGAISAQMIQAAFEHATGEGGKFNNMMNQIGETTFGQLQILEGSWENFKIKAGKTIEPLTKGLIKMGSSLLNSKPAIIIVTVALGGLATAAIMASLATTTVTTALNSLKAAMMTNPATMWIAGISALIGVVGVLVGKMDEVSKKANTVNDDFRKLANNGRTSVLDKTQENVGERVAEVKSLLNILQQPAGTVAKSQQQAYLKQLKGIQPDFFGGLNMNNIGSLGNKQLEAYQKDLEKMYGGINAAEQLKSETGKYRQTVKANETSNANSVLQIPTTDKFGEQIKRTGDMLQMGSDGKMHLVKNYNKVAEAQKNTSMYNANLDFYSKKIAEGKTSLTAIREAKQTTAVENDKVSKSVVSGGPRVININGVTLKFADRIDISAKDPEDILEKIEPEMKGMYLRVLNSGAKVQ